jgi:hypothetical protein
VAPVGRCECCVARRKCPGKSWTKYVAATRRRTAISPCMPSRLSGLSSVLNNLAMILIRLDLKECRAHTQKVVCELGCMREALNCVIHIVGIPSASDRYVQFQQLDKQRNRSFHSQVSQTECSRLYESSWPRGHCRWFTRGRAGCARWRGQTIDCRGDAPKRSAAPSAHAAEEFGALTKEWKR